jgi:hypothetical protein
MDSHAVESRLQIAVDSFCSAVSVCILPPGLQPVGKLPLSQLKPKPYSNANPIFPFANSFTTSSPALIAACAETVVIPRAAVISPTMPLFAR